MMTQSGLRDVPHFCSYALYYYAEFCLALVLQWQIVGTLNLHTKFAGWPCSEVYSMHEPVEIPEVIFNIWLWSRVIKGESGER